MSAAWVGLGAAFLLMCAPAILCCIFSGQFDAHLAEFDSDDELDASMRRHPAGSDDWRHEARRAADDNREPA